MANAAKKPLSDEDYFIKYGMTREESLEKRKIAQKQYMKNYHENRKKKQKRKKKSTAVVVRKNTGVKKRQVVEVEQIQSIEFTREDLAVLETMRAEVMELYRSGINNFLNTKRRNSND